jgi:hypothetical protein
MRFLLRFLTIIQLAVLAAGDLAFGQSAWYEGFEGPEVSGHEAGGDVRYKILGHQRTKDAHTGQGCEWYQISAEGGTFFNIAHNVGQPRVIEELLPTVWIKSDRPGLSISARVVLPRTIDPRTNKSLVTTIIGDSVYNDVGRWQQLRIADMPKLVARQVRALHEQLGPNVEGREAYVEAILLNIYGGPGVTNVWIDDLDIAGFVNALARIGLGWAQGGKFGFPVADQRLIFTEHGCHFTDRIILLLKKHFIIGDLNKICSQANIF